MRWMKWIIIILSVASLFACSLAPKYVPPVVVVPVQYKEIGTWLKVNPQLASCPRGPWWEAFNDSILNDLEAQINFGNQNLKVALARYEEARADVTVARAGLFPKINGIGNAFREQTSKTNANPFPHPLFNDFLVGTDFNYELDLWGKIRNMVVAAKSAARASAADLAFVELSLHAELANDYFYLRGADNLQRVLDETIEVYRKALVYIQNRHKEGTASAYDVDLAQNQLEAAKTLAADNRLRRGQYEHAIAVLVGQPPALFCLAALKNWQIPVLTIDPEIPSILLERRPDIAEAEQLVRAANANIGVARAAFFPQITLGGGIGTESKKISELFKAPSLVWALGPLSTILGFIGPGALPLINQNLFAGGVNIGLTNKAKAQYLETVAHYRQTVLNAFQEVEDNLLAIHQLDHEYQSQKLATVAAKHALQHNIYQLREGTLTYLDTVIVRNIALQAELSEVNIQTQRQIASVQLIRALGGGWDRSSMDAIVFHQFEILK